MSAINPMAKPARLFAGNKKPAVNAVAAARAGFGESPMTSIVSPLFSEANVPEMRVVTITPAMAQSWLKRNSGNRPLKQSHVLRLAKAIGAGGWKLTGDPIRFSETGKLIDGQHRLQAIVLADQPAQCVVMQGLSDDIFDVIDSGSVRSRADAVHIKYQLPVEKTRLLSSTATIACYYERGIFSFRSGLESSDVLAYLDANPDMVDAVEYVHSTVPRESPVAKSIIAAFYFFARRLDHALADRFILRFGIGAVEGPSDNLLYLRNQCQNMRAARRPMPVGEVLGRLIVVWNSERRGRPIKHPQNIRVRGPEGYPRFI